MDFLTKRKNQLGVQSLGDRIRSGKITTETDPALYVQGPEEFDRLHHRWARKEVLGILGGSGSGKSSLTLSFFKEMLSRPDNINSVCVFISLEMTAQQIYEGWLLLVGHDSELTNRLFIVENCDEDGKPRDLTTGGILSEVLKIKNGLGLDVLSIAIDHLQIISLNGGNDHVNNICGRLKGMSVELNTLLIILTQTTKANQAEYSDLPLFKSDSFGGSGFTWYTTWIISIHQPLKRVFGECLLPILAWAYVKIRYQHKDDIGIDNKFKLMYYDLETGTPRKITKDEFRIFDNYYELVKEKRETEDKAKGRRTPNYDLSASVELNEPLSEMDGEIV